MATPHFIFTNTAKLSSISKKKGNIIMVNDGSELYIDFSTTTRVRIGVGDPLGKLGIQTQLDAKAPKNHTHKYVSGFSVSGKTVTYTLGDGTTGTFTTQDTNTTYSAMTGATASAAGKTGLVPAPAAGKQAQFLRGDGTWQVPYTLPAASVSSRGGVILKHLTTVSHLGWITGDASTGYVPTISCIAFWNGAYADTLKSNLAYCVHGAIGTAATLSKANVIKTLSIKGKIITVTKGDNTTFTLETQDTDTNTTYSAVTTAANGLATPAMLNKANGLTPKSFSIPTSSWAANTSVAGYSFRATISVSGITANDAADVIFAPASLQYVKAAQVAPGGETLANGIYVYAVTKPTAAISGSVVVYKAS